MYHIRESIRPSADLRNHYNEISKQCREENEAVIIPVNGRGDTVSLSYDEYKSMKSRIELLELLANKVKKPEQEQFVQAHPEVQWEKIEANKNGTYAVAKVKAYLKTLQASFTFAEDSLEAKLFEVEDLLAQEKELKAEIKADANALHLLTKVTIEALQDEQVLELLEAKWVQPIVSAILALPNEVIEHLTDTVQALADKYAVTYTETTQKLTEAEHSLADLIDDLTGDEFDMTRSYSIFVRNFDAFFSHCFSNGYLGSIGNRK